MLKFDIVRQLKEIERGDKVIIAIDSIGNTASLKELEDALDEKSVADMQRAKSIKSLFRMVTPSLVAKDIPCLAICHTYNTMEMYSKAIISGGTGLMYSANTGFIITKSQEKEGTDLIGYNFKLTVEKSRYVKEKSKLEFTVTFDGGIKTYSGLMDIALESGHVVKPNQGWYQKVDISTGELIGGKLRLKDTETEEFWSDILKCDKFDNFIMGKYKLGHKLEESRNREAEIDALDSDD
jgi:hypothetical protein